MEAITQYIPQLVSQKDMALFVILSIGVILQLLSSYHYIDLFTKKELKYYILLVLIRTGVMFALFFWTQPNQLIGYIFNLGVVELISYLFGTAFRHIRLMSKQEKNGNPESPEIK